MRVVVQRVSEGAVHIGGACKDSILKGMVVLAGFETGDTVNDVEWVCNKIAQLRIFPDARGVMNLSAPEVGAEVLLVSQFTLHASTRKGNRPSYIKAARPEQAIPLYLRTKQLLTELIGRPVKSGEFVADMQVELINDGPVTIVIDSKLKE